jgi:glycosyltransferase involved in cell wall biosynthesis
MKMNKTIPLSSYIRTLNEADRIGSVIQSVLTIGAEVIVIDCGSTDGTQEIAEQLGARVINQEWLGNGHQKKIGEQAATYDWLLDLDADEVLSPELQQELKCLFSHTSPEPGVYTIKMLTVPPFPYGKIWKYGNQTYRKKLYHRDFIQMPAHAAWDQLPNNLPHKKLKHSILHYSFQNIEQQVQKMNHVSTVRATETHLKPKSLLCIRILFSFPHYFFKKLIKNRLYREGVYGFACAAIIASNRWLKDVKMYELHLSKKGKNKI